MPSVIRLAARDYDPSGVNRYLVTLAGEFHRFYNACRIKGEEAAVLAARLKLADTVRAVIANSPVPSWRGGPEKNVTIAMRGAGATWRARLRRAGESCQYSMAVPYIRIKEIKTFS